VATPNANLYGQSLAEWGIQYGEWLSSNPSESQVFGHVLFPVITQYTVTGSGTLLDPIVVTGHLDVTVKPGTAFFSPLLGWQAEDYQDGSRDPVVPDDWFGTYFTLAEPLVIDGQAVVTSENVNRYYFPPQELNPPYLYPQPTSYGSIGFWSGQGWGVLCEPLAVGVHQVSFSSSAMVPVDNGVLPYEFGQILRFSYTISVVP
jgi:hypothetical protein